MKDRWTVKLLSRSIVNAIFNLEKGYFFTIKSLTLHPGKVVQDYLNGKTINYTNPFRYALIGIAISIFFTLSLGIWDLQVDQIVDTYRDLGIIKSAEDENNMRGTFGIIPKFMNFIPFLILPFLSFSSWLFFQVNKCITQSILFLMHLC